MRSSLYIVSLAMGCPRYCRCTRIWCAFRKMCEYGSLRHVWLEPTYTALSSVYLRRCQRPVTTTEVKLLTMYDTGVGISIVAY